jgi:hypothetical protein
MRRDELMKPDMVSEILLVLAAAVIFLFLGSTAWVAMINHF